MAAPNVQPLFSRVANLGFISSITAASVDHLGGGATLLFTADATNGSFVTSVLLTPLGTNVASVLRIWINNAGVFTTTSNNVLFSETSLPATTITEVAAQTVITVALNFALAPGFRLGIAIGTAVATGWAVVALGGSY